MILNKCRLGELIAQRREKYNGEDLPICGVCRDGLVPPKQQDADISIYNMFYRNDFVFNPARMELNSIAFNDKYDKAICSSLYEIFYVTRTDLILPEYLKLIVKRDWFARYCMFLGQGSVREYCRVANISEIEIEFPSIEEQKAIVRRYNVIQDSIDKKIELDKTLYGFGVSLLKEQYEKKESDMFYEDYTDINKYCQKIKSGGTPSRDVVDYWKDGNICWLKNGEIKNNIILFTEEKISSIGLENSSAKIIKPNSVCMAMYCVSNIQVSINVVPLCTNQAVLNMETNSLRESSLLYYLLASYGNLITEKANGSAQQNLSKEIIGNYSFRMPNMKSKKVDILEQNIKMRILLAREIAELSKLRTIILKRL